MAVRLEGTIKRYIGVSTDEKPMEDVPAGSSFLEEDTGLVWRFNGGWRVPPPDERMADLLQAILAELVAIRERAELVTE